MTNFFLTPDLKTLVCMRYVQAQRNDVSFKLIGNFVFRQVDNGNIIAIFAIYIKEVASTESSITHGLYAESNQEYVGLTSRSCQTRDKNVLVAL